jgi:hypothetical protein
MLCRAVVVGVVAVVTSLLLILYQTPLPVSYYLPDTDPTFAAPPLPRFLPFDLLDKADTVPGISRLTQTLIPLTAEPAIQKLQQLRDEIVGEGGSASTQQQQQLLDVLRDDVDAVILAYSRFGESLKLSEGEFTASGRLLMTNILKNDARRWVDMTRWQMAHPAEWQKCAVVQPLFLVSMPRTGSSFTYELLTADEDLRTLKMWETFTFGDESLSVVPPLGPDDREASNRLINATNAELGLVNMACPTFMRELEKSHATDGANDDEDYPLFTHSGVDIMKLTKAPPTSAGKGTNPFADWFYGPPVGDVSFAYRYHRRYLQTLMSPYGCDDGSAKRWAMKSPTHPPHLTDLLREYPDAQFIFTHRDLKSVVPSTARLVSFIDGVLKAVDKVRSLFVLFPKPCRFYLSAALFLARDRRAHCFAHGGGRS